jgi:hypothetical protein
MQIGDLYRGKYVWHRRGTKAGHMHEYWRQDPPGTAEAIAEAEAGERKRRDDRRARQAAEAEAEAVDDHVEDTTAAAGNEAEDDAADDADSHGREAAAIYADEGAMQRQRKTWKLQQARRQRLEDGLLQVEKIEAAKVLTCIFTYYICAIDIAFSLSQDQVAQSAKRKAMQEFLTVKQINVRASTFQLVVAYAIILVCSRSFR